MKQVIIFSLLLIMLLSSFEALAGKKHCQSYRKKLDSIQAQQRQANSNKRSKSLATQEAKARNNWWQCENGKLTSKTKKISDANKQSLKKVTERLCHLHYYFVFYTT